MRTRRLPFYECRQGIFEIDELIAGVSLLLSGTREPWFWIRELGSETCAG